MQPSDQFESQLKEILDSGSAHEPLPARHASPVRDDTAITADKKHVNTKFELLLRIAGIVSLIVLLLGFALRIALF